MWVTERGTGRVREFTPDHQGHVRLLRCPRGRRPREGLGKKSGKGLQVVKWIHAGQTSCGAAGGGGVREPYMQIGLQYHGGWF